MKTRGILGIESIGGGLTTLALKEIEECGGGIAGLGAENVCQVGLAPQLNVDQRFL